MMVLLKETKAQLKRLIIFVVLNLCSCANGYNKRNGMIYILQWTDAMTNPFQAMEVDQSAFINRNCTFKNCIVTNDTKYLNDITDFDVLAFNAVDLYRNFSHPLPTKRSAKQKYILVSRESSAYYPVSEFYDNYFNWTWTYRLDSDINFGYVAVRNSYGKVIGPKKDMHWISINKMRPTSKYVIRKLRNKHIAVAWFVSNCEAKNKRLTIAANLKRELYKYGQELDIYGRCGDMQCPVDGLEETCLALIESDYYFYLAFENSFDEDYVTEKLLIPLQHFAVPVVFGGANYTRFLPDGIYLDACNLGPEEIAREINDSIKNMQKYYEYFKWHNHYSFHNAYAKADTDGVCEFCATLNNATRRNEITLLTNFSTWWNISTVTNKFLRCGINVPVVDIPTESIEDEDSMINPISEKAESIKEFLSRLFSFRFFSNLYYYLSNE